MTEHPAMMELMQQALDGGLDAAAQGRLDAHVATCAGCAQEWTSLQALHGWLLAAPQQAASTGFTARVLARIAAEQSMPAPVGVAEPSHSMARHAPAWPLLAAAGVLGLISVALALAPLAGLASFDVLAGLFADSLGLLSVAIAWLSLLLTFIMVAVQTVGDGLLAAALVVGLVMTLIWIRLVAGAGFFHRQAYINGGV